MSSVEKLPAPTSPQLPAPPAAAVAVTPVLEITALAPAARAAPLARVQGAARQLAAHVQYRVARVGIAGHAGLAALTAAAVLVVSVLVPSQHALQAVSADLARARHTSAVATAEQAGPRLVTSLPTRAEVPKVIGQVFAEAKAAGVPLDTGRYLYTPAKGGEIARYELEFPVKASYPDIRSFIDHTLAAVPAAALGKLRIERKAVGDAVVTADIEFLVFLRSGEAP